MNENPFSATAQLWVGAPNIVFTHAIDMLQRHWCPQKGGNQGCKHCQICRAIAQKQFVDLLWLAPEESYTLEQFEPLFDRIALACDPDRPNVFVITRADALPAACANRLLKIVEEPPAGYHFLFLAQRAAMVLATIRSRCLVRMIGSDAASEHGAYDDLLMFFKQPASDGAAFLAILDRATPSELESIDLIDDLLQHWSQCRSDATATHYVALLHKALCKTPMPGSSKIFWRNLFLQFNALKRAQSTLT